MRLIALSFLLFTFSCTSSPVPFSLDDIKVTQAEITEVVESEEESEHMLPHLRDMDFSNSFMSQEGFDKIEELIAYSIKLEKAEIKIKDLNNYKEIFLLKIEDAIFLSENLKGEISSIFIECLIVLPIPTKLESPKKTFPPVITPGPQDEKLEIIVS